MHEFTNTLMADPKLDFLKAMMMGPNALRITEEMASHLEIKPGSRILDLGCGWGLSTLLLVEKYGAEVFAADFWISPTENYERFQTLGIADRAVPLSVDATKGLPFANEYFDILFTVDAYHYFGDTPDMLPSLIPFVNKGGYIAIAIPGIKYEFGDNVPEEMRPWWHEPEVARTIHSLAWWKDLWAKAEGIEILDIREMDCHAEAWAEWLASPNPYAVGDIEMMKADGGKYFNTIQMIAKVK
ncbi:MAG: methyltransferase domain-containing protein [Oscillospiraceae bacterium]|nr:methyltransferase domain-containing protein [Oscillospiraceae bacterium]